MKNLNENEKKVFVGCIESAGDNGYDFGWSDEVKVDGLTVNQIKGYLGSLTKKHLVEIEDSPTETYDGQMTIVGITEVEDYYSKTPAELAEELLK